MQRKAWSEWQIVQLQECLINGIAPGETAALLGKTKDEVCAKARELDLLFPPSFEESPPVAPELPKSSRAA
jgi:hypothetical protein